MSTSGKLTDNEREYPNSHLIQGLCFISFFIIWILDSYIVKLSIGLASFIPLELRLVLFLLILIIAIRLIQSAHDSLLSGSSLDDLKDHNHHHPNQLIESGIMAFVRHPLYLGTVLVYLSFVVVTLSLGSLVCWIIIYIIYDQMASYEEQQLELMFGNDYLEYRKRVPKWFTPKLLSLVKGRVR